MKLYICSSVLTIFEWYIFMLLSIFSFGFCFEFVCLKEFWTLGRSETSQLDPYKLYPWESSIFPYLLARCIRFKRELQRYRAGFFSLSAINIQDNVILCRGDPVHQRIFSSSCTLDGNNPEWRHQKCPPILPNFLKRQNCPQLWSTSLEDSRATQWRKSVSLNHY